MGNVYIAEIFEKLLHDDGFRKNYFLGYADRFVYSATDLEKGLSSEERKAAIQNLLLALKYLMDEVRDRKLSFGDIVKVGDLVNLENGIAGIRKVNVSAGHLAEWHPVYPRQIYLALYNLLNNYYNVWCDRDIYEREALFHIGLMRIHPFEDGNKRTAKIIMNANFVKQNYPPVIITEEETELYYKFINDEDEIGFAKFLKSKSLQELNTLMSYYKVAFNIPITDSVIDMMGIEISGGRN